MTSSFYVKKILASAVGLGLVCTLAGTAEAQDNVGIIAVDGAVVLPTSDWSHIANIGLGAMGDIQYGLTPEIEATGRLGLIYHLSSHYTRTWEIPILAGMKYGFGVRGERPYAAAEIGLTSYHIAHDEWVNPATGRPEKHSFSELDLSMTLGGGYEMERFDFRGALYIGDIGHPGSIMGILGTVGYAFTEF